MRWLVIATLLAGCSSKDSAPPPSPGGGVRLTYELDLPDGADPEATRDRAVEAIRERVDALKPKDASVYWKGGRIYVEIAGDARSVVTRARAALDRSGRLEFRMVQNNAPVMRQLREHPPTGAITLEDEYWSRPITGDSMRDTFLRAASADQLRRAIAGLDLPADQRILLEEIPAIGGNPARWRTYVVGPATGIGQHIRDATVSTDSYTNQPVVMIELDKAGARQFAELTRAHVGDKLAIVLDGTINSAPIIQDAITGGTVQLNMGAQRPAAELMDEAHALAAALRSSSLPVPLKLMSAEEL